MLGLPAAASIVAVILEFPWIHHVSKATGILQRKPVLTVPPQKAATIALVTPSAIGLALVIVGNARILMAVTMLCTNAHRRKVLKPRTLKSPTTIF